MTKPGLILSKEFSAISLVAPSSPFAKDAYLLGIKRLRQYLPHVALNPMFDENAELGIVSEKELSHPAHLAGGDNLRASYLNRAFLQDGLVMMARGGFGASRLLKLLDWPAIVKANPSALGFSDFTVLLNTLASFGVISFHGPNLTQLPYVDDASMEELAAFVKGRLSWPRRLHGSQVNTGQACGRLMGGNLTMICHLLGTSYEPDLNGSILFVEEVNESAYRLDRMLSKLELAGMADKIAGVALGDLHGWHEKIDDGELSERRFLALKRLRAWGKPFICDLPFGHAARNRVLPVGAFARMENGCLEVGI